jgi:hypothetical protein
MLFPFGAIPGSNAINGGESNAKSSQIGGAETLERLGSFLLNRLLGKVEPLRSFKTAG